MSHSNRTLVQFMSPWQGRLGFKRYRIAPDGQLSPHKPVKCKKMIRKAASAIDGLLLRPAWPTRRALCLVADKGAARLLNATGGRLDTDGPVLSLDDPSLRITVADRLLYRRFGFSTDDGTLSYRDMAGRLIGPQRMALDVFPEEDFSPFARLAGILRDERSRTKLLSGLAQRRFDYSRWIGPDARRLGRDAMEQPA
ncbi:hypothetical protein [uncultured Algimonas sp.]|uniref:hypothetical protein n=1 Tax=uncultured Algimonas sp. TaxID=1547920 RepID=UPI002618365A|nr:hypothetical protein [uncultured Algimonas sp.]